MKTIGFVPMMLAIALSACEQSPDSTVVDDPVLARVGDSAIHQSRLDAMLDRLSPEAREQLNSGLETRLLEGMVRTRALAFTAEQQLSADEKKALEAKVEMYRDELLAQIYINRNITPQPVTADMVQQYYQDHRADYTVPGKVSFEVIATTADTLDDAVLSEVLDAYAQAGTVADWKHYAAGLEQKEIPVAYRAAKLVPASIDSDLRAQVARLQAGEVSDIVYGDAIYILRVIEREPDTVKPLNQVSVEIRKKLVPQKLKQALAQHIDQAMQDLNVEYTN